MNKQLRSLHLILVKFYACSRFLCLFCAHFTSFYAYFRRRCRVFLCLEFWTLFIFTHFLASIWSQFHSLHSIFVLGLPRGDQFRFRTECRPLCVLGPARRIPYAFRTARRRAFCRPIFASEFSPLEFRKLYSRRRQ